MFDWILVVEDNEQDQKIIARYLRKAGVADVMLTASGEEGVAAAKRNVPPVVLVDTLLPGIDGFETCRQLKAVLGDKSAIIIMTGRISAVDADRAKAVGADEYCVKTADCGELLGALKAVLAKNGSAGPSPAGPLVDASPAAGWQEKNTQAIRTLSREIERKNEELSELDLLKSKFVSNISHELRTPLAIIDGAVSQVAAGIYGAVNVEQDKKLKMALRASGRLRGLIDNLLDFAKLEAKKVALNRANFELVEVVSEMHAAFYDLAKAKGVELSAVCPTGGVQVFADRNRLLQVFTNLVGNALKFTAAGKIELRVVDCSDRVECLVSDTGRGLAKDDLPKVFGRFQQFGAGSNTGGTGLGLSICKEIVDLHGGTIGVESELGKGTVFKFILPKNIATG